MKMQEGFVNSRFNQDRNLRLPVVLLLALFSFSASAGEPATKPAGPTATPVKKQTFKPGTPEAAVAVLLNYDFTGEHRASNEYYISPLYEFQRTKHTKKTNNYSIFKNCGPGSLIKSYRIIGGSYADPTPHQKNPATDNRVYYVVVEAEVLTVSLRVRTPAEMGYKKPDELNAEVCGWLNLEIINNRTGEVERHGDVTVDEAHHSSVPFEKLAPPYVNPAQEEVRHSHTYVVEPHRRLWRFRVPLMFEVSQRFRPYKRPDGVIDHKYFPHRGWVLIDPYLPRHKDVSVVMRELNKERNRNIALLNFCAGKGKPIPNDNRPSGCTPEMLKEYREGIKSIDVDMKFIRALQDNPSQEAKP